MTDKYRYFEESIFSGEFIYSRWNVETERMDIRMLPPNDTGWESDPWAYDPESLLSQSTEKYPIIEITESVFNFKLREAQR